MSNRLRAIQEITRLACPEDQADLGRNADLVATSLIALGVSLEEIRDAMQFALLTTTEE